MAQAQVQDEYSTPIPPGAIIGQPSQVPQASQSPQAPAVSSSPTAASTNATDEYSTPIPPGAIIGQPAPAQTPEQKSGYGNEPGQTQDYLTKTEDFIHGAAQGAASEAWGFVKGIPASFGGL